jgi:hypothetical protein
MSAILCVGDKPALNHSRAAVLRTTGCRVDEIESSAAVPLLNGLAYDMVVLCHTVPANAAAQIVAGARTLARRPKLVRIGSPFGDPAQAADDVFHVDPSDGPRAMVERVCRAFDLPAPVRPASTLEFAAPASATAIHQQRRALP